MRDREDGRARVAPGPPLLITSGDRLREACERWRRLPALGLDTEFVRERTFYPALGLIQVADGTGTFLIDPLAISDLGPLAGVLAEGGVTKIVHSAGEDLEVLYHRFGAFPQTIFDTQIAATLVGLGFGLGYGALVEALFGAEVPKDVTRTNWRRRPLTSAQLEYAALDVAYLPALGAELGGRLRRLGRESWAEEEFGALADAGRFFPEPETIYRKMGPAHTLAPRQLALLRELCAWREREARRRDLPRNFVLREAALVAVARRQPRSSSELAAMRVLQPEELRRHGRALVELVQRAERLPEEEVPPPLARPPDLSPYRSEIRRLRQAVAAAAEELGIPAEFLASRKTVEQLVREVITGAAPPLSPALNGWRRQAIGDRLDEILAPLRDRRWPRQEDPPASGAGAW